MPNVNGLVGGFEAQFNGSVSPSALPQSTSSPVNSQNQQSSPGVASYPPVLLEKSEGASAEVTVHTGDSLQSLRLSIPMQETELCKHKLIWSESPLPHPTPPLHFNIHLLWLLLLVLAPCLQLLCLCDLCFTSKEKGSGVESDVLIQKPDLTHWCMHFFVA